MQQSDGRQARAQEARCSAVEGLVTVAAGRKTAPRAAVPPRESPTAVEGVEADLLGLPASPAGSGLAASALALARSIDDSGTSATARAACVRALMVTMREIVAGAPERERRAGADAKLGDSGDLVAIQAEAGQATAEAAEMEKGSGGMQNG